MEVTIHKNIIKIEKDNELVRIKFSDLYKMLKSEEDVVDLYSDVKFHVGPKTFVYYTKVNGRVVPSSRRVVLEEGEFTMLWTILTHLDTPVVRNNQCFLCGEWSQDIYHENCGIYQQYLDVYIRTFSGKNCLQTLKYLLVSYVHSTNPALDIDSRVRTAMASINRCNYVAALTNEMRGCGLNRHIREIDVDFNYFKGVVSAYIIGPTIRYLQ